MNYNDLYKKKSFCLVYAESYAEGHTRRSYAKSYAESIRGADCHDTAADDDDYDDASWCLPPLAG